MIELAEAVGSVLRHVSHPESRESYAAARDLRASLHATLTPEMLRAIPLLPPPERALVAARFQSVMETLQVLLYVAVRVEQLGGRAEWASLLREAIAHLERSLQRVGIPLEVRPPESPPEIYRDAATGEFRITGPSLVQPYIAQAIQRAQPQPLEDGRWFVELPGFPGVWADGETPEACLSALAEVLEDWLRVKLSFQDDDIPVVAGINLATFFRPR